MNSEALIQRQILDWLHVQYPDCYACKLPVSGMRVAGGRMVKSPLAGMPDIFIVLQGRYIGLEVKQPGKEKRKDQQGQRDVQDELRAAGGQVFVVTSLEEAQAAIYDCAARLRWKE